MRQTVARFVAVGRSCYGRGRAPAPLPPAAVTRMTSTSPADFDKPLTSEQSKVFKHDRLKMYVCWHPETPFPYEMTQPIDTNAPVTDSNLKIQALTPVREAFRPKYYKLMIQELMKLTYTTKHRFFTRFGKMKRHYLLENQPNKENRPRPFL